MRKQQKQSKVRLAVAIIAGYLLVLVVATLIVDGRHHEMRLCGDQEVTVEYGSVYEDPGAEVISTGRVFGALRQAERVPAENAVDTYTPGSYTLEYVATVKGEQQRLTRRVTVVDSQPPVIELVYDEEAEPASWMRGYVEPGYTATDNRDGDLTAQVVVTKLDDSVVYTVSDSSGNETIAERKLAYSISAPEIVLNGGDEVEVYAAMTFTDPGYQAVDSLGNDLTEYVTVSGSVRPYKTGDYELTYTIKNEQGDTVTKKRTVKIVAAPRVETVKPEQKTIYLTFDDGPGPYTDQLLDVLAKYGVKATFFVTGAYPDYYDCIGRAYEEGHSIGVHTFTHNYRQVYASEQAFFDDFNAAEDLIFEQTGSYTKLFRFPGGSSNTVSSFNPGIMGRLATYMRDMGYYYFDWNVSSGDAGATTSTSGVYDNVISGRRQVPEGDPLVVLQHDIKDFSVAAVENIIVWGLNNGYQFLPLDESSYGARHGITN